MLLLLLLLISWTPAASAQYSRGRPAALPKDRFTSGTSTLRAFTTVAETARESVVRLDLDGKTVALGAIVESNGLVITKASELKEGKLMCRLADGKEVDAELAAIDNDNDVALVKISAAGLKPVAWASGEPTVGQWAVTPGLEATPEAVGIISVPTRKLHKRALIGVQLDFNASDAKIARVMTGFGAEKAGIKPGDVILAVNDSDVKNSDDLQNTLRNFRGGASVKVRVRREEQEFDATIQMIPEQTDAPQRGGRGFLNRAERMNRMGGRLSQRAADFELAIQHDTVLQPWQCGGPLVNLEGKAIGLNIARAGRAASYALPADLVKQLIEAWVSP